MSCVVCRNENCAEIDRSHLMFDNLRNILNTDFTSIKISLQKIKGKGKIFIEDYIHCPFCYEKLPEVKTFIFLIKEAEMISEKKCFYFGEFFIAERTMNVILNKYFA